jgi:DNA-binding transcriptional LysR family regulator
VEAPALYEEAQCSPADIDRIARAADEVRDWRAVRCAAPAVALSFLLHAIAEYLKTRPDAHVSLVLHSFRSVVDTVIGQRYDVGFASLSVSRKRRWRATDVNTNGLYATFEWVDTFHITANAEASRPVPTSSN